MTDKEIVQRLIEHDEQATRWFFHDKCRPLFLCIMRYVFNYPVEYDEVVNEIYLLLMEDDAKRLRQFDHRSSIYQWIKIVTLRHFVNKRSLLIDEKSKGCPYKMDSTNAYEPESDLSAHLDIRSLLEQMENRRFAYVIQRLVIDDSEPKAVAEELKVTVDNLYNIKKRAITAMTLLITADKNKYHNEGNNR